MTSNGSFPAGSKIIGNHTRHDAQRPHVLFQRGVFIKRPIHGYCANGVIPNRNGHTDEAPILLRDNSSLEAIEKQRFLRDPRHDHRLAGLHDLARHSFTDPIGDSPALFFREIMGGLDLDLIAVERKQRDYTPVETTLFIQHLQNPSKGLPLPRAAGEDLADLVKGLQLRRRAWGMPVRFLRKHNSLGHLIYTRCDLVDDIIVA